MALASSFRQGPSATGRELHAKGILCVLASKHQSQHLQPQNARMLLRSKLALLAMCPWIMCVQVEGGAPSIFEVRTLLDPVASALVFHRSHYYLQMPEKPYSWSMPMTDPPTPPLPVQTFAREIDKEPGDNIIFPAAGHTSYSQLTLSSPYHACSLLSVRPAVPAAPDPVHLTL